METAATPLVSTPQGVLAVLTAVVAFFFFLERQTRWKLFEFLPPLIFIYATPVFLNNLGVIPAASPVYGTLKTFGLPAFIVLMLIGMDIGAAIRIMGKGVIVMLIGSFGVVVGGVVAYAVVHRWLDPAAWAGYGALSGSWIGGTGNMNAVAEALETPPEQFGLAVVADQVVYLIWLPIMLGSKSFADRFNRWARVPADRLARMEAAAAAHETNQARPTMIDYLYLAVVASAAIWISGALAAQLPELGTFVSTSTWRVLLITTFGIAMSFTPIRRLAGSHELAMAIIYIYVARVGATASLEGLRDAPVFVAGAFLWIFIHGAFCLVGARLFRIDVHSVAIASAANIGGAASAPIVAAAHRESLVPASILMALIGYAIGNYLGILTGRLCQLIG